MTIQPTIAGPALQRLMRKHRVTIRELARRIGYPMTRVRHFRNKGIHSPLTARDYIQAITGVDPGPLTPNPLPERQHG